MKKLRMYYRTSNALPSNKATRSESGSRRRGSRRDESGAVLILALIFVVVVGALVGSLASWASNDLRNTAEFTSARTIQYAVSSTMENGIQNIRYSPLWSTQLASSTTASNPSYCWGSSSPSSLTVDNVNVAVWCSTVWTPTSANTRVVTLSACTITPTETAASCAAAPALQAVVTLGDYPAGYSAPNSGECQVYCGTSMTINSWIWAGAVASPTTTTTVSPTTTTTTTVPPTTTTTTTAPQSNGVTVSATPTIYGSASVNYGGQDAIQLTNPSAITNLTITIQVAQTTGVYYNTEFNNFWGQWGTQSYTTNGSYIVYTYVLNSGQTMNAGYNGSFTAQYYDGGQAHDPAGDSWTVTSTSGGVTSTLSGVF